MIARADVWFRVVAVWEYLFLEAIASGGYKERWSVDGEHVPDMDGWHIGRVVNHFAREGWELMHLRDGPFLPAGLVMRRAPRASAGHA